MTELERSITDATLPQPTLDPKAALVAHRQPATTILGITKADVAAEQRKAKAAGLTDEQRIKKDFRVFLTLVWRYLGLPDPTPIQLSMAQYLQYGPERFVIMAFRGVAKSFVTMAFALWTLYCDPQKKVLVVSGSKKRADAFTFQSLAIIRGMPLLQHLSPRPEQRQSSSMFDVGPAKPDQSASFTAAGITGQITGLRADLIVGDDVETATNSLTVLMREKLADGVREFDAIIKPGGRIGFLGTPHTADSIYNKLPGRGYSVRIWTARYPSASQIRAYGDKLAPFILNRASPDVAGKTTEPTRFTDDDLAKREMSWGKSGFALQYMLDTSLSDANKYPLKLGDLMVMGIDLERGPDTVSWGKDDRLVLNLPVIGGLSSDIIHRPASVSERYSPWEDVRACIDPSGDGEDETALAVVAKLNGRLYVLYCGGWVDGYGEGTLKAIAKVLVRFRVRSCRIESNFGGGMFMSLLKPILVAEWKRYNDSVPAAKHGGTTLEEERAPRVQKEQRIIEDLEPVLNQHRLVVAQEVVELDYEAYQDRRKGGEGTETAHVYSLFHQLTNLTRERDCLAHDDRIEALGAAVGTYREELGVNPEEMAENREEQRVLDELEKLLGEADDLQGLKRFGHLAAQRSQRHQGGRSRAGR